MLHFSCLREQWYRPASYRLIIHYDDRFRLVGKGNASFRHDGNGIRAIQYDQLFSRLVGNNDASRLIVENDGIAAACDNALDLVVLVPSFT